MEINVPGQCQPRAFEASSDAAFADNPDMASTEGY